MCSTALLKTCRGMGTTEEEVSVCDTPLPPPPLLVLAVLPTLAGDGNGENPPGKGDLDWPPCNTTTLLQGRYLHFMNIITFGGMKYSCKS